MRAVVIADKQVAWREYPDPEPAGAELLVRVASAGINGADIIQRAGHYPPPPGTPTDVPGLEMAGVVEAVGPRVQRFAPGDAVMALLPGAGQAELCVVDERLAMPVPDGLPLAEAGGVPEAFATAHDALFTQCGLQAGERLLVTGAAGGVGLAGVQLGVLAGAHVVASVRSAALRPALEALGALAVAPEQAGEHGPYDVVLELLGGSNLAGDLAALAAWGRIIVIGLGAGTTAQLDLRTMMSVRARVLSSTLRARPLEERALVVRRVERLVLAHLASGRLRVHVQAAFAFEQVAAAYDAFTGGGKLGKILLHH